MFLDASAIVAILGREPGHAEIETRLASGSEFYVSPMVRFEASVALARQKAGSGSRPSPRLILQAAAAVETFITDLGAREVPITAQTGSMALEACARFGKAVGHEADLNFGDCFAYACAYALRVPLVYKGNDFSRTDLG